ncbi:MAG: MoaD/ThiS family protein [Hyphomicrobiales bacterium]
MVKVGLWGSLKPAAGGADSVEIEARDIRGLLSQLGELHPGLKPLIERKGIAVSINGRVFRDSWGEPIPDDAEIYLLPRIAGG